MNLPRRHVLWLAPRASISVLVNKALPLQPQNWAPEDLTSVGTVRYVLPIPRKRSG